MSEMLDKAGRLLTQLARQTPSGWRDLIEAQLALVHAQCVVLMKPVGQLIAKAPSTDAPESPMTGDTKEEIRSAIRAAIAVRRVADYGVLRPKCLARALALSGMLERRGIRGSSVRVGVKRVEGQFSAHAWVELRGRVLGDEVRHVGSFSQLADLRVMKTKAAHGLAPRAGSSALAPNKDNVSDSLLMRTAR